MRACLVRICVLALVVAAPSAVQAQRILGGAVPTNALHLRVVCFGSIEVLVISSGDGMRRVVLQGATAPGAGGRSDSVASRETRAEAGAVIGGLAGAVVGASRSHTGRIAQARSISGLGPWVGPSWVRDWSAAWERWRAF